MHSLCAAGSFAEYLTCALWGFSSSLPRGAIDEALASKIEQIYQSVSQLTELHKVCEAGVPLCPWI